MTNGKKKMVMGKIDRKKVKIADRIKMLQDELTQSLTKKVQL